MNLYKFVFTRYLLYGFIGLEILLLPVLLLNTKYAELEFIKHTSNLLPLALLGAQTGYMKEFYERKNDYYIPLFQMGIFILIIVGVLGSLVFNNFVYSFTVIVIGVTFIFEKYLLVKKRYNQAIIFKPLLSVSLLGTVALLTYLNMFSINRVVFLSHAIFLIIILSLLRNKIKLKSISNFSKFKFQDSFKKYYGLIKQGILLNLTTILYTLFLYSDRFIYKEFYNSELPNFSLAYNFAMLVIIGLTSINMIQSVDLGERLDTINFKNLKSVISKSLIIFILIFTLTLIFSVIYGLIYPDFQHVWMMVGLISMGLGFFFIAGAITPIIFYKGRQKYLTFFFAVLTGFNLLGSWLCGFYRYPHIYVLIISFALMFIYSCFCLNLTYKLTNV